MSRADALHTRLGEAQAMVGAMLADPALAARVDAVTGALVDSLRAGGKVLLCGNGGSSADAQHLAAEMVGRFYLEREPFPAISLSDNVAAVTAIGNDYAYDEVFARAVRGLGRAGDVLIGLSTSGRSRNVVRAIEAARERGIVAVAFVGAPGWPAAQAADWALTIPTERTASIQEGHIILGHIIFELVEAELCAP